MDQVQNPLRKIQEKWTGSRISLEKCRKNGPGPKSLRKMQEKWNGSKMAAAILAAAILAAARLAAAKMAAAILVAAKMAAAINGCSQIENIFFDEKQCCYFLSFLFRTGPRECHIRIPREKLYRVHQFSIKLVPWQPLS